MNDGFAAASSFRDPSGFVFFHEGTCYRQVNRCYQEDYERVMASGLYEALVDGGLLVPHEDVGLELARSDDALTVIRPRRVPFVSYPYEWCFSELKDAALATLGAQKTALEHGMVLKDASAYNVQFLAGRPVLIDTLSFERYREGQVWVAYRQFCQHFLAPLALMSARDVRLSQLLRTNIDGVPLDLASSLLPRRTWLRPGLLMHLHLHAKSQRRYAQRRVDVRRWKMSLLALRGLVDSLETLVRRLAWRPRGTEWADYYAETNYTDAALEHKHELVARFVEAVGPATVWDLGANVGRFSRIASDAGARTIAFDVDPACVELTYLEHTRKGQSRILPLLLDLANPSPGLGWAHDERLSLADRGPADLVMALALVHHLAISNNVPLDRVASFLARLGDHLIVEFVPKCDSQVQRLLVAREDVFPRYTRQGFEQAFAAHFQTPEAVEVRETDRVLYLMRRKEAGQ
ncbi:MAG: SAM-dependent methyltransferase [Candidatus Brocadiia bacterium]